ncbi:MAG: bifunctional nicotinamidase/pyrazinamidase [Nitrososphaeria archaeon]
MFKIDKRSALIVVDVLKDFCSGGALAVPDGDKVVPVLNKYIELFSQAGAAIYATRDWHPSNHISFRLRGGIWPPHCVQGTDGAEFHPDLKLPKGTMVMSKGANPDSEAYSGFEGTDLETLLKERGVNRVFVGGLATDYCVKNTVLDALKAGFEVVLLEDASRGVNLKPRDSEEAIEQMTKKGARRAGISDFIDNV